MGLGGYVMAQQVCLSVCLQICLSVSRSPFRWHLGTPDNGLAVNGPENHPNMCAWGKRSVCLPLTGPRRTPALSVAWGALRRLEKDVIAARLFARLRSYRRRRRALRLRWRPRLRTRRRWAPRGAAATAPMPRATRSVRPPQPNPPAGTLKRRHSLLDGQGARGRLWHAD
jgi:hypothetical protein